MAESRASTYRVVAAFRDALLAHECVAALRAGGIDPADITLAGGAPRPPARRPPEAEAPFLGRLVLIVVAWSIVGAAAGVVMGLAFNAAGIGPGGAAGMGIQIGSWAIFVHMIAGMWAGYGLLTRGESREPVTRTSDGRVLVSIACTDETVRDHAVTLARRGGAIGVGVYDQSGRQVPAERAG